jgi:hypothetical protein
MTKLQALRMLKEATREISNLDLSHGSTDNAADRLRWSVAAAFNALIEYELALE